MAEGKRVAWSDETLRFLTMMINTTMTPTTSNQTWSLVLAVWRDAEIPQTNQHKLKAISAAKVSQVTSKG